MSAGAQPVTVAGAKPANLVTFWLFGGVVVLLGIGLVTSIVAGAAGGEIFFGMVFPVVGLLFLLICYTRMTVIGRPYVTAQSAGLWTRNFELPWSDVKAMQFVIQRRRYTPAMPTRVVRIGRRQKSVCSLVVTRQVTNEDGRPVQYGQSLPMDYTQNLDELMAAARSYAPHVQARTYLTPGDFVVDPAVRQSLLDQLAATGQINVVDKNGRSEAALGPGGIAAGKWSVPWSEVDAVVAYTQFDRTYDGRPTAFSSPWLKVVTKSGDSRPPLVIDYRKTLRPTIEQLASVLSTIAPNARFVDERIK